MSDPDARAPAPTVDVIIELDAPAGDHRGPAIVLIERKYTPHGWALPGGFVDYGEVVADAAAREALEETGLRVELRELFHVYSDPGRDARRHTISTVFIGTASGQPRGSDDAARAGVFHRDDLPALVFDHQLILDDYFRYRDQGVRPPPRR
jgi:8-oxo-dGTP diphosphatase